MQFEFRFVVDIDSKSVFFFSFSGCSFVTQKSQCPFSFLYITDIQFICSNKNGTEVGLAAIDSRFWNDFSNSCCFLTLPLL